MGGRLRTKTQKSKEVAATGRDGSEMEDPGVCGSAFEGVWIENDGAEE